MRVEVNRVIETGHDLHVRWGGLLRAVPDRPLAMRDTVDDERTVHDVIIRGVDNGEDVCCGASGR